MPIESQARELVEDLARRSGLSPAELLRRLSAQEEPEEVGSQDFFSQAASRPYVEPAPRPYVETPRADLAVPPRAEVLTHPGDEMASIMAEIARLTSRIEQAENRSTLVLGGMEHSVRGVIARLDDVQREQVAVSSRFEGAVQDLGAETSRTRDRLRKIEEEAAGPRSAEALKALEGSLGRVATHLYEGESRTQQALNEMRARVDRFEASRPNDPAILIDAVVGRISERMEQAETRANQSLEGLQSAFADLDGRLKTIETPETSRFDQRLEALASDLHSQVEQARAQLVEAAQGDSDGRLARMERSHAELTERVAANEKRNSAHLDRIGRDMTGVVEALGRKVQGVENRGADAVEQIGAEMSRVAQAIEAKLARSDAIQAQALEKLGDEISRITERMAERIANAERRSAQAIDDVGEQVARVTERMNSRAERASSEIADRIRLSEERTTKLLDEAKERIEQRLAARAAEPPAYAAPFPGSNSYANPEFAPFGNDPFAGFEPAPAEPAFPTRTDIGFPGAQEPLPRTETFAEPVERLDPREDAFPSRAEPFDTEPAPAPVRSAFAAPTEPPGWNAPAPVGEEAWGQPSIRPVVIPPAPPEPPRFGPEDFEAADDFVRAAVQEPFPTEAEPDPVAPALPALPASAPVVVASEVPAAPEPVYAPTPIAAALPPSDPFEVEAVLLDPEESPAPTAEVVLSTREIIERARAAARSQGPAQRAAAPPPAAVIEDLDAEEPPPPFGNRRSARGGSNTLQSALVVSGGLALVTAVSVGVWQLGGQGVEGAPNRLSGFFGRSNEQWEAPTAKVSMPRFAVARNPQPAEAAPAEPAAAAAAALPAPTRAAVAAEANGAAELYARAAEGLRSNAPGALADLRRAANLGHAPAQFYLARIYDEGTNGVSRDAEQARVWTERAARGGSRQAMHNLALNYYEGSGRTRDPASAAQWFRRAADAGLVDSQYNLGRLYESGVGVTQNAAEAYKWYLIAARAGDGDARASASRMRDTLTPSARMAAERAAQAFRATGPEAAGAQVAAAPPPPADSNDIMTAQRALSRLRYLQGPADGRASVGFAAALSAFQRDQGLAVTGRLDANTLARLAPSAN